MSQNRTLWEQFLDWVYNTLGKPIQDGLKSMSDAMERAGAMNILQYGGTTEHIEKLYPDLEPADIPILKDPIETGVNALVASSEELMKAAMLAGGQMADRLQNVVKPLAELATNPLKDWIKGEVQSEPAHSSRITYDEAMQSGLALLGSLAGVVVFADVIGMAVDFTHPFKKLGFQELIGKVAHNLGASVAGPLYVAPFFESRFTNPIRRHMREQYSETDYSMSIWNELYTRRKITSSTWQKWITYLGYPDEQQREAVKLLRTNIPLRTLKMLHKLEPFPDHELYALIGELGYEEEHFDRLARYVKDAGTAQEKVLSIGQWLEAFEKGLRSEDVVRQKLIAFGYDSESIQLALDLHAVKAIDEERGILDSEVKSLLQKGLVTEERAREMWRNLRYTEEAITTKISLATWQRDQTARDASVATYKNLFVNGIMEEREYRTKLSELGMSADGVEAEVASAILKTTEPVTKLTKTEVLNAYEKGITNREFTEGRLREMNVPEEDLAILLELNKPKVAA